ncbi:MAG: VWA domain-containing protein [Syntrophothermus sp.]|uniref:VWA domain-containing protein n=1 Tax=Syntrophothermus sp. TaxID=2736299 RepID=UPI00257D8A0F|nr:VWA domain-containing protein [Syntrophothermus sp.]NSW83479.1 VWA domain-containing protein [Syntrophothermus sp.]
MSFLGALQSFFDDLRREGVPVTPGQAQDCVEALLLVDWEEESFFYTALYSTLVKDHGHLSAFNSVYERHFRGSKGRSLKARKPWGTPDEGRSQEVSTAVYAADALPVQGMQALRGGLSQERRSPLDQPLGKANLQDIHKIEALFPVVAKRLAARLKKKNKQDLRYAVNYRQTLRKSMGTGGVLLDIITMKKQREKPVIVAICDVSGSVMNFSCFALALLASMQRFFREFRSFAFIEDMAEVTALLASGDPLELRNKVLKRHRTILGARGYTNYGASLKRFVQQHGQVLSHKTTVLIFGDARNNWFADETWALAEIKEKARKVYWFNPEPKRMWGRGDSRMLEYAPHCDRVFSCPSLSELEKALECL